MFPGARTVETVPTMRALPRGGLKQIGGDQALRRWRGGRGCWLKGNGGLGIRLRNGLAMICACLKQTRKDEAVLVLQRQRWGREGGGWVARAAGLACSGRNRMAGHGRGLACG